VSRALGIDISHWKPVVDWAAVAASGVRFVGIKATEGKTYVDKQLRAHRSGFRQQPFTLGIYYHFARSGSPRVQADRLLTEVGVLQNHERLALDFEVSTTANPEDGLAWIEEFFRELNHEYSDRRHIIYTSKRIWRTIGDPAWPGAANVDLWCPRYNASGVEPALPKPWSAWTIWQFTDGDFPQHVTPGVGRCDANWFCGDDTMLIDYAKLGMHS
jgi:lysozyme